MNFIQSTAKYESWLARHLRIVQPDLESKHKQMRAELFPFFRATYYRWAQVWPRVCEALLEAPRALIVGDLHVENFGTWRDIEGRLIWGINDFDEAWRLPVTNDLVRLAASAALAGPVGRLKESCAAILEGYRDCLRHGGRPYVLAEENLDLRAIAAARLKDPGVFWRKLDELPLSKGDLPKLVRRSLERAMPERGLAYRVVHRTAGMGSLGRERFVAIAEWDGGQVAREAKALAPSACSWAAAGKAACGVLYQEILDGAVRCPDPFVHMRGNWIVRRLAPDCCRIELTDMPTARASDWLLHRMGWETANVHLGTMKPKPALAYLKGKKARWLETEASRMVKAVESDWKEWRKAGAR